MAPGATRKSSCMSGWLRKDLFIEGSGHRRRGLHRQRGQRRIVRDYIHVIDLAGAHILALDILDGAVRSITSAAVGKVTQLKNSLRWHVRLQVAKLSRVLLSVAPATRPC